MPMRNWNLDEFYRENNLTDMVFRVPMRNWNLSSLAFPIPSLLPVFRVPMRNWNSILIQSFNTCWWVFRVPMRNWNISSCWKPCKHPGVFRVPMRNWNQLLQVNLFHQSFHVFRVPMRNWNPVRWNCLIRFDRKFLECLWGIETEGWDWG